MKKSDIPFYNDPEDFENGDNKYPCDTQYMVYNPLLHRYYLTAEGLRLHGVEIERYYTTVNANKVNELIEKTSKKVYDYIQYKAGKGCYQVQMYRIATAPTTIYPDQYYMRKQFEEALAYQAKYICESGDTAQYSQYAMEKGGNSTIKPQDNYRDTTDMAPETIRILETLGLNRWFNIIPQYRLDLSKY